jgi:uncharacterized protein (DUF433 family)
MFFADLAKTKGISPQPRSVSLFDSQEIDSVSDSANQTRTILESKLTLLEQRDGCYYVSGTRVSLDSVVYAFLRGESPEGIVESFPALSLEQAYGAVAFYLAHQQTIDTYLQHARAEFDRMREEARRKHPALYAKLDAARRSMPGPRA